MPPPATRAAVRSDRERLGCARPGVAHGPSREDIPPNAGLRRPARVSGCRGGRAVPDVDPRRHAPRLGRRSGRVRLERAAGMVRRSRHCARGHPRRGGDPTARSRRPQPAGRARDGAGRPPTPGQHPHGRTCFAQPRHRARPGGAADRDRPRRRGRRREARSLSRNRSQALDAGRGVLRDRGAVRRACRRRLPALRGRRGERRDPFA